MLSSPVTTDAGALPPLFFFFPAPEPFPGRQERASHGDSCRISRSPFGDAPRLIREELLGGHMRVTATWGCLRNGERTWSCPGNRWNAGLPWQKSYRISFSEASLCFFRQITADMTAAVLIKIPKGQFCCRSQTCSNLFIFTRRLNPALINGDPYADGSGSAYPAWLQPCVSLHR